MASQAELDRAYDLALKLTAQGGEVIRGTIRSCKEIETKAGEWDLVTQYDRQVEEIIVDGLRKEFPAHKFIGEESVAAGKHAAELGDSPTWIIDPIDGTTNFVHSFPFAGISLALAVNREPQLAVVYNPVLEQLFTARKGRGSFLNGQPIKSSKVQELGKSLLCIEASYATIKEVKDVLLGRLEAFVSVAQGIRTMGSAALTLCYVAMGAAEAYHSDNLMPWDVAAGVLIVEEAGGTVIDTHGGEVNLMKPKILAAGNRKLALDLAKLIKQADSKIRRE